MSERKHGWYVGVIGIFLILGSIYFWDNLPETGTTELWIYEPYYHYSLWLSRFGTLLMIIGFSIWTKDNWKLIKSEFAIKETKNE